MEAEGAEEDGLKNEKPLADEDAEAPDDGWGTLEAPGIAGVAKSPAT